MSSNVAIAPNPFKPVLNNFIHTIDPICKKINKITDVVEKDKHKDRESSIILNNQMLESLNKSKINGVRLCIKNFDELKNENPLGIWRTVNNELLKAAI